MEDATATALICKDEIDELNYDQEPITPEQQEVLQESQIDEFEQNANSVEVTVTMAEEKEDDVVSTKSESELKLEQAPQIEDYVEPAVEPIKTVEFVENAANGNENRSPSPIAFNTKKMAGGLKWPPENNTTEGKKEAIENEALPKKRVSDLIARFNNGNIENDPKKTETSYKSEYGATESVGKVNHNFA
ncbi:unnamed protein product [Caenorhabditis bovis]|uniref:Uncharacterized protein n=1 Tax=Caenorhabditis bovis TaxID=2654633 RepID=A0A8S1ED37_9PELO|nr:unnamed protein product [Caenorhabditis bovis]